METSAKEPAKEKPEAVPPARPRLALNIAIAGARKIPEQVNGGLDSVIDEVLLAIDEIVLGLTPAAPSSYELCAYYSDAKPELRFVSGLADGVDQRVADRARKRDHSKVEHILGAVIPFSPAIDYRDQSAIENKTLYDALLKDCAWVHILDGKYVRSPPDDAPESTKLEAKRARARAYRAQSDVLLRQCDVLIAVSDPAEAGSAGGTRETLMSAVALGLPIIHISLKDLRVSLIDSRAALSDLQFVAPAEDWHSKLRLAIAEITAAPFHLEKPTAGETSIDRAFFDEFFGPAKPLSVLEWLRTKRRNLLHAVRDRVEYWMDVRWHVSRKLQAPAKKPRTPRAPRPPASLEAYRDRASELSAEYAGLYRGAFFLNYALAVVAVFLAAISLLVYLWPLPRSLGGSHGAVEELSDAAAYTLIVFAVAKFLILLTIYLVARAANKHRWNEKAVNFRYVSERLRAMSYLPNVAILRPPVPSVTRVKPRRVQTTIADWLAMAAIRATERSGAPRERTYAPTQALETIGTSWLKGQVKYHEDNAGKTALLTEFLDRWARRLSISVIAIVVFDLALLLLEVFHMLSPAASHLVHDWSPLLIFIAVVLPAAVAGANGVRFQSECERLADRSEVFALVLEDMRREAGELDSAISRPTDNPQAWMGPVAIFTERCAQLFVDEVSEWSVLYAKELGEA